MILHIEKTTLETGLVENLFLLGGIQEQGTAAEVVGLADHALGVIIDSTEETFTEKGHLVTSDTQVVLA